MRPNPFIYDRPLAPGEGVRRAAEEDKLVELAISGQSARLSAARRMGKTTLVGDVCARLRHEGFACAIVDLSGLRSGAMLAERIAEAWGAELERSRKGASLWKRVSADASWEAEVRLPGARLARRHERRAASGLGELLDLPRNIHPVLGLRCYVVFDEFQEVLASTEGLDGEVRARIQHHGGIASYCFAGSQAAQLRTLFTDRDRPLFAQAEPVEAALIATEEMAAWIAERFAAAGLPVDERTALAVARAGGGHPQRTSLIANRLFGGGTARFEDVEEAAEEAYAAARAELEQAWEVLSPAERDVVSLAAAGSAITSKGAEEQTGRGRSTLSNRRRALISRAVLVEEGGRLRVVDPFLARFALRGP